jgi:nitrite reductase/ring-hydroxylating ferredoxin subunit
MSAADETFDTRLTPGDIDPERPRPLLTPWGTLALYRLGEQVHALQAFCPHLDGPLFEGSLCDGEITCPWHGWRFDVATGERVDAQRPIAGSAPLVRCAVRLGPAGTLVLERPSRAIRTLQ